MDKYKYFIGFKMDDKTHTYFAGSQEKATEVFKDYGLVEKFKTESEALKRFSELED